MNNIVEFPIADKPITESGLTSLRPTNFTPKHFAISRSHIGDCVEMSQIAAQKVSDAKCNDEGLAFAVFHTHGDAFEPEKALLRSLGG